MPVLGGRYRLLAVQAYLHELAGDLPTAAAEYADAAARATSVPERNQLIRRAALLRTGTVKPGGRRHPPAIRSYAGRSAAIRRICLPT